MAKVIVTFPLMGIYTKVFEHLFKELGIDYITPPPITKKTIELGTENLDELMCYPAKTTFGNIVEGLDNGANTVVMFSSEGLCRFKNYYVMHKHILDQKGYDYRMCVLKPVSFLKDIKNIDPKNLSYLKIIKALRSSYNLLKKIESEQENLNNNPNSDIKILVTGEIYCVNEDKVNMDLIKKLRDMNVHVEFRPNLIHFLQKSVGLIRYKESKEVKEYLPHKKWPGHGFDTLNDVLGCIKQGYDGAFHIYPFPCFTGDTEITIEGYLPKPIKDIQIGDKVLTHKGRFREVTETFVRQYDGDILDINCGGLLKFKTTPEHPILALKRKVKNHKRIIDNPKFINANELVQGDFIAIPKPKEVNDLCKEYSHKKVIHSDLMMLEPELQLEIAKGFFRGDGHLEKTIGGATYSCTTTSYKLANQLFWILIRNNIKSTFMGQNKKDRKRSYTLKISNIEGIKRFNDKLIEVPNKVSRVHFLETEDYFLTPIRKINKENFSGEVYNLAVKEDNSYMANRLAVHNCMPDSTITKYLDIISEKHDFPIAHIQCDEFSGEAGFDTRIEAFVDSLRFKKQGIDFGSTETKGFWLGIDIGSVSTKVAIIDQNNKIVQSKYILISGNPIEGVKKCFKHIKSEGLKINGVGVTGSARYLISHIVGADIVVNEITAQSVGSLSYNKDIRTIIEIGGLDSKCILIKDGVPVWHNTNSKCSSGSGSFLMREAERVNIPIEEFGDYALKSKMDVSVACKCTVFAGQDCIHKAQHGFKQEDIIKGLHKGMVRNFINNTVRNRKLEEPIIFNGGVAANKGVVEAFNEHLNTKVIVPEDHKVMGAKGAAILSKNVAQTKFKGFHVKDQEFDNKNFTCGDCPNNCEIVEVYQDNICIHRTEGICGRWAK